VLVRFGGATAADRARSMAGRLAELGLEEAEVVADDGALWEGQRAAQRAPDGLVAKIAGVIGDLEPVLRAAADTGARAVSRAALGLSWLSWPTSDGAADRVGALRERLPTTAVTVLDGARALADPWPAPDPGALAVMERVKVRFDPARVFSPGHFVGGL
jgi:glycolate oxidase FAD binding subunit